MAEEPKKKWHLEYTTFFRESETLRSKTVDLQASTEKEAIAEAKTIWGMVEKQFKSGVVETSDPYIVCEFPLL